MIPPPILARIKACRTLPTMPGVAMQIVELCRAEEVAIKDVADVLKQDPALSARILRYANSSTLGLRGSVKSVHRAAVLLGGLTVQTLALSFSLATSLQNSHVKGFDHKRYWRRSLFCAASAQAIAAKLHVPQPEVVFVAALLQDVGMLVLAHALGSQYIEVVDRAGPMHEDLVATERARLGFDHAAVTSWLAEQWNLPRLFIEAAESSHKANIPHLPGRDVPLGAPVALASYVADIFCVDDVPLASQRAESAARRLLKFGRGDLERVLNAMKPFVAQGAELLDVDPGPSENIQQILEDARESLLALTVRSSIERRALEDSSQRDPLTRLWNRAHLDKNLEEMFAAARLGQEPFSVAFCDIDKFKSVNDTYGHAAGDDVLKSIAHRLASTVKEAGLVGRYGGEEFVVLMPRTDEEGARATCEAIREAVAARPSTLHDGRKLQVTISIGFSTTTATTPGTAELLHAADSALYAAKRGGRNRVCAG